MKCVDNGPRHHHTERDAELHRAVQKLVAVRRFASLDNLPCKVAEGLYIGSLGAARNLQALQSEGITHVLNASPLVPCFHRRHLRYKVVTVYDDAQEDIAAHFDNTNHFIAKGRKKGAVLVHCYAGMSRSATFVLAYLMACERMSFIDAMHVAKKARPVVAPNSGFMRQLHEYSERLGLIAQTFSLLPMPRFAGFLTAPPDAQLSQDWNNAGMTVDNS